MAHAIARQRNFNPRDFRDDVHDLARVNPEKLAEDVTRLARKKNAADGELDRADSATRALFGSLGALAVTAAVGMWEGSIEATRDAMIADWEAAGNSATNGSAACSPWEVGVKDPAMAFWKVPKLALPPIFFAIVAGITASSRMRAKKKALPGGFEVFSTQASVLTFGLFVASILRTQGYCQRERQITTGKYVVDITPAEVAA